MLAAFIVLSCNFASAEVYLAQDEALARAFPGAETIERRTFILDDAQAQQVERRSQTKLESRLFTFFEGQKAGRPFVYAAIHSHHVRTMNETVMIVLAPNGEVEKVIVLAFHEPKEYLGSDRWLSQFDGRTLDPQGRADELKVGNRIAGIVGSTLTSNAVSGAVRQVMVLFDVLVKQGRGGVSPD